MIIWADLDLTMDPYNKKNRILIVRDFSKKIPQCRCFSCKLLTRIANQGSINDRYYLQ